MSDSQEKFRDRIIPLTASALATLTLATCGSYLPFGARGTLGGLAVGSVLSGAASWWYERWLLHSRAALARARAKTAARRWPHSAETVMLRAVAAEATARERSVPWLKIAVASASAVAVVLGGITAAEALAGKPYSAIVHDAPGHGLSVGGGTVGTPPPATYAPMPETASPSPSLTPAASPVPTASVPPVPTPPADVAPTAASSLSPSWAASPSTGSSEPQVGQQIRRTPAGLVPPGTPSG